MTSDNTTEDDREGPFSQARPWQGARYIAWRAVLCLSAIPIALAACYGIWRLSLLWSKP